MATPEIAASIQRGGLKHQFKVADDTGQANLIGDLLDDGQGPASSDIKPELVCENRYEKDFTIIASLPYFYLHCYNKQGNFKAFVGFMDYVEKRKKLPIVTLDRRNTTGYLWPENQRGSGPPRFKCYYHQVDQMDDGSVGTLQSGGGSQASVGGVKRPLSQGSGGGEESPMGDMKRPRPAGSTYMPQFNYIPVEKPPPLRAHAVNGRPEDGPGYDPGDRTIESLGHKASHPHPCLYPRSTDPAFVYYPPDGDLSYLDMPEHEAAGVTPDGLPYQPTSPLTTPPSLGGEQYTPVSPTIAPPPADRPPASSYPSRGQGGWGRDTGRGGGGKARSSTGTDQALAESFYNKLNRDKDSRNKSLLFHMRNLNNWVKSVIITESRPADPRVKHMDVLDLGCGKGGDFFKWREAARRFYIGRYVGVDIAQSSLDDAIGRYSSNQALQKALGQAVTLACADLGGVNLTADEVPVWEAYNPDLGWQSRVLFEEQDDFDVISMQFALHYMFQSKERARRFFRSISTHLRVGGMFIATTMDARVTVEALGSLSEYNSEDQTWVARRVDEEGRELCTLEVDEATYDMIFRTDPDRECPLFGLRYFFTLREGFSEDGGEAVKAPEWMVPLPLLRSLGEEYGLRLEYAKNFHEVVEEGSNKSLRFLNYKGTISDPEWELARMYVALKFVRVDTGGRP